MNHLDKRTVCVSAILALFVSRGLAQEKLPKVPMVSSGAKSGGMPQLSGTGKPTGQLKLREKYDQLERQATRLADQYRDLARKATRTPGDVEALKRRLTDMVNQAFESRQKLQRAELAQLRGRFARIERQIATRDRIKDAIIARRVEKLLDPNLAWQPASASGSAKQPARGERYQSTPFPPQVRATPQVQIDLILFEATESVAKQLGAPFRAGLSGTVESDAAPDDFHEKLQGVARDGEAKIVAKRVMVTVLGRPVSVALPGPTSFLRVSITCAADGPDTLGVEIVGLAPAVDAASTAGMPSVSPRAAIELSYQQPTIVGPFECPTKGRRMFLCLTLDRVVSPPPSFPFGQQPGTSRAKPAKQQETTILRSAEEFARQLNEAKAEVERMTQLQRKDGANAAAVESARRRLAILQEEYSTQMHLLHIELKKAEAAAAPLIRALKTTNKLYKADAISELEMLRGQRDANMAELDIERVTTLLDLYRKVDPRGPAQPQRAEQTRGAGSSPAKPDVPAEKKKADTATESDDGQGNSPWELGSGLDN